MNTDSINDPKNNLNHYIYEGVKGFYRITFEPFLKVKLEVIEKQISNFLYLMLSFHYLMLVQSITMEIHIQLQAYFK